MNTEVCKNCKYYADVDSYKDTGYCKLFYDYVKENDNCVDFEEVDP